MTTLREKMKREMTLIGLSASTQKHYVRATEKLSEYYNQSPAKLSEHQIQDYLIDLKGKLSPNSYNLVIYAFRFFYCITLKRPHMKLALKPTQVTYKLPEILSTKEVEAIINVTDNIKHKTLLMLIYGTGLRVSEAVNLRIQDIDSQRMTLHIRDCKNRRERYVILPPLVYEQLRRYWSSCRFSDYIFPGKSVDKPMSTQTASQIYKRAKANAGITKAGGIHGLRHAFATHMLEAGEDIFKIKELLGHRSISSTVRYLSFVPHKNSKVKSPIETLNLHHD